MGLTPGVIVLEIVPFITDTALLVVLRGELIAIWNSVSRVLWWVRLFEALLLIGREGKAVLAFKTHFIIIKDETVGYIIDFLTNRRVKDDPEVLVPPALQVEEEVLVDFLVSLLTLFLNI